MLILFKEIRLCLNISNPAGSRRLALFRDSSFHERLMVRVGGERGIRTLDGLAPIPVFETGAFNHSATSPVPAPQGRETLSTLLQRGLQEDHWRATKKPLNRDPGPRHGFTTERLTIGAKWLYFAMFQRKGSLSLIFTIPSR